MSQISQILAREILDSRGLPTVEVELSLSSGQSVRVAVPSGASTGAHEAHEMRDKDPKRFGGKGVLKAIENVHHKISPYLKGQSVLDNEALDKQMLEMDGTPNKSKLGANAILAVSLAVAKAKALAQGKLFFESIMKSGHTPSLPIPLMNVLNGGAHANNGLDVQEFMVVPTLSTFGESLRAGSEIFHGLKSILNEKGFSTAVGDEGGFAPKLESNSAALELLMSAIEKAGYSPGKNVYLALDVAATELYSDQRYQWEGEKISAANLLGIYKKWIQSYPIVSIEDGFSEDDWQGWKDMTQTLGSQTQVVGDDLFVTNIQRIQKGIEEKSANALLVKMNQIGTISETVAAVTLAKSAGFRTIMSHRSGETEDASIADLAVGLGTDQIKTGSACRGERTAKYNQLLRIEAHLGAKAHYIGSSLKF